MLLKPWYDVLKLRKELCENVSQEWLEFAVPLHKVREAQAADEYGNPAQFFRSTYLSHPLTKLACGVLCRLAGSREHPAIFSVIAPHGGGKTHALTMLYHVALAGSEAVKLAGVPRLLAQTGLTSLAVPRVAVFPGATFDPSKRRSGKRGDPHRKTLWGELAFQLGGSDAFDLIEEDDVMMRAPARDTLQRILPQGAPCLMLIDDLLAYIRRESSADMRQQIFRVLSDIAQLIQQEEKAALVITLPPQMANIDRQEAQELQRYIDLFRHLGEAVTLAVAHDAGEILRRRLFVWDAEEVSSDGKVILPDDALETCRAYGKWGRKHLVQFPAWFPSSHAERVFRDAYPFHPELLSVFTRKWSSLPTFESLRGMLRLMALLLSVVHRDSYSKVYSDALISSGVAPLERFEFRDAVCAQLGWDQRLEVPIFTDICGQSAFAARLDADALDDIKHNRLHQKTATAIFLESVGGISETLSLQAAESEIRLAVGEPDFPLKSIDTVLDALAEHCYYLTRDEHIYRFNLTPNLNKLFADRHADIDEERIDEQVKSAIQQAFAAPSLVVLFPETPADLPDRPAITLVVAAPDHHKSDAKTLQLMTALTHQTADGQRIFKNGILWALPENDDQLRQEARSLLTWQDMYHEFQIDPEQIVSVSEHEPARALRQIADHITKTEHRLHDLVWQAYHHVALLNKAYEFEFVDLGHLEPGGLNSLPVMLLNQLRLFDYVADSVSPRFLKHNWPAEYQQQPWSAKAVKELFFKSPHFPRLTTVDAIKDMIAKGATSGLLAYVGPKADEKYAPFFYQKLLNAADVELSDSRYILSPTLAEAYLSGLTRVLASLTIDAPKVSLMAGEKMTFAVRALDEQGEEITRNVHWEATGGTIDEHGVFTAGEKGGSDFEVRATVANKSAWVKVSILSKKPESPEEQLSHPAAVLPEIIPPAAALPTTLHWAGTLTPQQFAAFGEQALAQLADEFLLTFDVQIEASRESGIESEQIDRMKAALREVGLRDDVLAS